MKRKGEYEYKNIRISSGVENWRRPVGLPLNFPLPILDQANSGRSESEKEEEKEARVLY